MKFDLISDFHVEQHKNLQQLRKGWKQGDPVYFKWNNGTSDVLVMAGDTSNGTKKTIKIVTEAASVYNTVLFLDGNHDHYDNTAWNGKTVQTNIMKMDKFARESKNIVFLNSWIDGTSYIQGDTAFIGCNGWYDHTMAEGYSFKAQKEAWHDMSNDSVYPIFGMATEDMARRDAEYLNEKVTELASDSDIKNIVIVTHTVPHQKGLMQNRSHKWYVLNGAYGNSLMETVWRNNDHGKIKTWVFGHTHTQFDFVDNGIRFVTNPRGYKSSSQGFKGLKMIDTDDNQQYSAFGELEEGN